MHEYLLLLRLSEFESWSWFLNLLNPNLVFQAIYASTYTFPLSVFLYFFHWLRLFHFIHAILSSDRTKIVGLRSIEDVEEKYLTLLIFLISSPVRSPPRSFDEILSLSLSRVSKDEKIREVQTFFTRLIIIPWRSYYILSTSVREARDNLLLRFSEQFKLHNPWNDTTITSKEEEANEQVFEIRIINSNSVIIESKRIISGNDQRTISLRIYRWYQVQLHLIPWIIDRLKPRVWYTHAELAWADSSVSSW